MKASPAPVEIDRLHLDRRDASEALRRRQKRTAGAQRHDHRLNAPGDEAPRCSRNLVLQFDRHAGQDPKLSLVRGEEIRLADALDIEIAERRGGVQRCFHAVKLAEAERRVDGLERHFELGQDEIAGPQIFACALDVGRREVAVRALDDEDAIVAGGVDENGRRSGRLPEARVERVRRRRSSP